MGEVKIAINRGFLASFCRVVSWEESCSLDEWWSFLPNMGKDGQRVRLVGLTNAHRFDVDAGGTVW